ncbi:MAG: DUF6159 family protein [Elusimicrobia bacterium]|nr:DUF6159 family protein [Elusimicrobiota bacterium]
MSTGKFKNSWLLFKASVSILFKNKKLLIFPIVIIFLLISIIALYITPVLLQSTGYDYTKIEHWKTVGQRLIVLEPGTSKITPYNTKTISNSKQRLNLTTTGTIYFIILYLIIMFLSVYSNVAFYSEIMHALKGESVSIRRGLIFASSKVKQIFLWSLFAGLVGYLISLLEQKVGFVGKIIIKFIGIAWSVSSIFVAPAIIVSEEPNPIKLLKNSATIIKKTWGESLIGYLGVNFASLLIIFAPLIVIIVSMFLFVKLALFFMGIYLLIIIIYAFLTNIISQIYKCALYLFAYENYIPVPYTQEMMYMGWRKKKGSGSSTSSEISNTSTII